eukprot:scaffold7710_cov63-Phaeocystis_antarctica.AAC.6
MVKGSEVGGSDRPLTGPQGDAAASIPASQCQGLSSWAQRPAALRAGFWSCGRWQWAAASCGTLTMLRCGISGGDGGAEGGADGSGALSELPSPSTPDPFRPAAAVVELEVGYLAPETSRRPHSAARGHRPLAATARAGGEIRRRLAFAPAALAGSYFLLPEARRLQ